MLALNCVLLLYGVYVPFFLAMYIWEIIVIIRLRNSIFNSSYYRTFTLLAVVNILACLLGSFVFRFPLYPLINGFYNSLTAANKWLTAAYAGTFYLTSLSEFMGVFLACNRFTALFFPMIHDKFWHWARFVGVFVCLISAFLPVISLFDDDNMFVEMVDPDLGYKWYYLEDISAVPQVSVWFNMVIVTVTCNCMTFVVYGACLVRLWFYSTRRNHVVERNLFLVGFLNTLFSLPYMAAMLYFHFVLAFDNVKIDENLTAFVGYQLPWLTDLKYLTPAPMLFLMSKPIRNAIDQVLPCGKMRIVQGIIMRDASQGSQVKELQVSPRKQPTSS